MGGSTLNILYAITGDPINHIIKAIGRALGIYSHDEVITDLRVVDLITAGVADKSARRAAIKQSNGELTEYGKIYQQFKKDYRKKYSAKFLKAIGYSPNTQANSRVLNMDNTLEYVQTVVPQAVEPIKVRGVYLDEYLTAAHYLQENYSWVNHTQELVYGGKTYKQLVVDKVGANISIVMTRPYEDTIVDYLAGYGYNGTTVWLPTGIKTITVAGTAGVTTDEVIVEVYDSGDVLVYNTSVDVSIVKEWEVVSTELIDGEYTVVVKEDAVEVDSYTEEINSLEEYLVGSITGTIVSNGGVDSYKVVCTKVLSPFTAVDVYIAVDRFIRSTTEYSYEVLYVEYHRSDYSSEYWFSYVENLDTIPSSLYTIMVIDMTAIVPVKEDNVIADLDEPRLKRMLRRLNIEPDGMLESLKNDDIDSTYIWTAIPFNTTVGAAAKTFFRTFDMMSVGSATVSVGISKLSMSYNFTITKSTSTGSVLAVGEYDKVLTAIPGETDESVLILRYQGSATEYKTITITGYTHVYTVSGHTFTVGMASDAEVSRLIVPLSVLNSLQYREFVEVYEVSLSAILYSMKVVHVKWYETGAFGMILKLVAIVIAVFSLGSATTFSAFLWALAEMVIMGLAVTLVLSVLGPELGALAIIVAIVLSAYTGNFGFSLETFKGYMATAGAILSTMDQAISMKTQELMIKGKEELEAIASKTDAIKELYESLRSSENSATILISSFDDTIANHTPNGVVSPDAYIMLMQGAVAYNYDVLYDVDSVYEKRKVVNSG